MKCSLLGVSVLLVAALAAGCGGGDQNGSGGSGAGGSATGGSHTGGSATGGSVTGTGGSTGGSSTGGSNTGGSVGGGGPCGGLAGLECAGNEWCDYPEDMCGADDGMGTCVAKPNACDDLYEPVCACDGKVYSNACDAQLQGKDVQLLGGCEPPAEMFACGAEFCSVAESYCQIQISDVAGIPNSYECLPLPANCGADPTCTCLSDLACGNACQESGGGLTLTCPGG